MADRIAQFLVGVGADDTELRNIFAGIKSRVTSDFADLQRASDRLDLFGTISDNLPKVSAALESAKAKVAAFTAEIQKIQASGGTVTKDLTDGLAKAEKAAASASAEFNRQSQRLNELGAQLKTAGVNTTALAAEQSRLALASKAAADAAALQAAKQVLGFTSLKDTEVQAARLTQAYNALKASGTLSATEISAASSALNARMKELNATVTQSGGTFKTFGETKATLTGLIAPALAAAAAVGSLVAAYGKVVGAAREFNQALAEGQAGTDLTKDQIAALGQQAQQLAQDVGVKPVDALKELFSLIRNGVGQENSIEVLRISAEAAKASFSDLGTGVTVAKLLLQDFKVPVAGLGGAFDVLKASVGQGKEGFEAFAAAGGPLLAVAKASSISLEDLSATLDAMVKGGIAAGDAMTDLTKIITALGKPEARQALHGIGIDATDLVTIFSKLGASGAKLQDVIDLTGVSKKNVAAIAALINDSGRLAASFDKVQTSSGSVKRAVDVMYDSPKEISERFHATLDVTAEKLGNLVGASGRTTVAITALLGRFNALLDNAARFAEVQNAQEIAYDRWALSLLGIGTNSEKAAVAVKSLAQQQTEAKAATEAYNTAVTKQKDELKLLSDEIVKSATALTAAVAEQVKAISEGATQEIASIELIAGARKRAVADRDADYLTAKDAAAKILLLQQQSAQDQLAAIQDGAKKIVKATDDAINQRIELAKTEKLKQAQVQDEILQIQAKGVADRLALYKGLYDQLYAQAKAGQDKVNAVDAERLSFNEGIELKLRGLRQAGLGDADRYAQALRDIDTDTSKARQALADGDFALGKKYTDDAIRTAETLKGVVNRDGIEVISDFQAQQAAIGKIKAAADQYSEALKGQGDAAKTGSEKAKSELELIKPVILDLQAQLDVLRKKGSEAIVLKIDKDIVGIAEAEAKIAELVRNRTIQIGINGPTNQGPVSPESGVPLARGGPVLSPLRQAAQYFAAGGGVFNPPTWHKVPGSGSGDTVPALLQEGSFVVRKAASQLYGDPFMQQLVRGYAKGGTVLDYRRALSPVNQAIGYANSVLPFLNNPGFLEVKKEIRDLMTRLVQARDPQTQDALSKQLIVDVQSVAQNYSLKDAFGKTAIGGGAFSTPNLPDFSFWLTGVSGALKQADATTKGGGTVGASGAPAAGKLLPGQDASRPDQVNWDWWKTANADWSKTETLFARGGHVGGDTVPAMLTPGEWVIPRNVAAMYGGGFLNALNSMQIPRFAQGGPVPGATIPERGTASTGGDTINVTINAAGGDLTDPTVQRRLGVAIRDLIRRSS